MDSVQAGPEQSWQDRLTTVSAALGAIAWGRRCPVYVTPATSAEARFNHDDWSALLRRFVHNGHVDYGTFKRVERILVLYLDRVAHARPETWQDRDAQLAFYLNAYNAIVIYQLLKWWPVDSFRAIPNAWTRPFPIGRRNMSLFELELACIRSYRDPRIHAALVCGSRSCPPLQPLAYTGAALDDQLNTATRTFLADPERGSRYDAATDTLHLSSIVRWFAGDWIDPQGMRGSRDLLRGLLRPSSVLPPLRPWLPRPIADRVAVNDLARIEWMAFDWRLNGSA